MGENWIWWALGALLLVGGGGVVVYNQTRGLRNNNPGNIRPLGGSQVWQGQVGTDNAKGGPFVIFDRPENGIRAMARVLKNYQALHGISTVQGIINRWAPGHENPTDAYVAYVAKAAGVGPADKINVAQKLPALVRAIIKFENGLNPYSDEVINAGVAMA